MGKQEHVVLVEDDSGLRRLLRMYLEGEGFQITETSDGVHALEVIANWPVDLLITDLALPNLDGFSTIQQALEIRQELPVLIITGYRCNETIRAARSLGMVHYLEKPFDQGKFIHAVYHALGRRIISPIPEIV